MDRGRNDHETGPFQQRVVVARRVLKGCRCQQNAFHESSVTGRETGVNFRRRQPVGQQNRQRQSSVKKSAASQCGARHRTVIMAGCDSREKERPQDGHSVRTIWSPNRGGAIINGPVKSRWWQWIVVGLILGAMWGLLWRPMVEDSGTIDEPVFVGAGYSYWHGHRYYFNAEHPPLAQLWSTLPLLWLDVKIPPGCERYLAHPSPLPTVATWDAQIRPREEFNASPPAFYVYPHLEAGYFGQSLCIAE